MMTVGEKGRYETIGCAVAVKDVGFGRFGVERLLAIAGRHRGELSVSFHGKTKEGMEIGTIRSAGAVAEWLPTEDGAIDRALVLTYLEVESCWKKDISANQTKIRKTHVGFLLLCSIIFSSRSVGCGKVRVSARGVNT